MTIQARILILCLGIVACGTAVADPGASARTNPAVDARQKARAQAPNHEAVIRGKQAAAEAARKAAETDQHVNKAEGAISTVPRAGTSLPAAGSEPAANTTARTLQSANPAAASDDD